MPESINLTQVATLAAQLPPAERKELAETILRDLQAEAAPVAAPRRRFWREIRGSVAPSLCGEDAQAWISRSRRESDEQREGQGRNPR
jgi:hypothetical protein